MGLYLVMYSPAKATLEVWRMRHGARYVSQLNSMPKGVFLGHTHVRPTGPISFTSLCCEGSPPPRPLTFFYVSLSRCIKTVAVSAGLQLVTVPGGPGPNGYILTRCLLVRRREDGVTAYAVELGTPQ